MVCTVITDIFAIILFSQNAQGRWHHENMTHEYKILWIG